MNVQIAVTVGCALLLTPVGASRYELEKLALELDVETQDDCAGMKDVRGCELVKQTLIGAGYTSVTPLPSAGGGVNLGIFEVEPNGMLAKLTRTASDYETWDKIQKSNPGIGQDPDVNWANYARQLPGGYFVFVMPKAKGDAVQDIVSKQLNGLDGMSPNPDFMRLVGNTCARLYQHYCGGCATKYACHGDFQGANVWVDMAGQQASVIDLDNLNPGKNIPEHDADHMYGTLDILKKVYSRSFPPARVEHYFQAAKAAFKAGFDEVCSSGGGRIPQPQQPQPQQPQPQPQQPQPQPQQRPNGGEVSGPGLQQLANGGRPGAVQVGPAHRQPQQPTPCGLKLDMPKSNPAGLKIGCERDPYYCTNCASLCLEVGMKCV